MSGRVTVGPDPTYGAGHALIRIEGLRSRPAALRFGLRRADFDAGALGPDGWQVAEALLEPVDIAADADALILRVGPSVCNLVAEGSVEFRLPAAGLTETILWPEIQPQHGGVRQSFRASGRSMPGPVPVRAASPVPGPSPLAVSVSPDIKPVSPAAVRPTVPLRDVIVTKDPDRRWISLAAIAVLLLAVCAFGIWWWLNRPLVRDVQVETPVVPQAAPPAPPAAQTPPVVQPPPVTQTPPAAPTPSVAQIPPVAPPAPRPPAPADLGRMSVPDIVARNNPAEMLEEANRRSASGRRDDGIVLMSEAANRHYPPALAALARLYDPLRTHLPGEPKDSSLAARYYREAMQSGETSVQQNRQALKVWLELQSRNNPLSSESMILKGYWP